MTTEVVMSAHRSWLPGLSLVAAAGAAALGLIAITSDDVGPAPAPAPALVPVPVPAVSAAQTPAAGLETGNEPIVVHLPASGEPCGLRIRGNMPC